jgi:hypothetical protein
MGAGDGRNQILVGRKLIVYSVSIRCRTAAIRKFFERLHSEDQVRVRQLFESAVREKSGFRNGLSNCSSGVRSGTSTRSVIRLAMRR